MPTALTRGNAATRNVPAARTSPVTGNAGDGEYQLITYLSPTLGDGRGANKPWLQELPDPVTKICWQTVVEMHGETAAKLGVEDGDMVTVTTGAGSLTAPASIYLGIRPDTIAVARAAGTGRRRSLRDCRWQRLRLTRCGRRRA